MVSGIDCLTCGYPIATHTDGERVSCPNCSSNYITEGGITIPAGLFWGIAAFFAGMWLGPSIRARSQAGQKYLSGR